MGLLAINKVYGETIQQKEDWREKHEIGRLLGRKVKRK